MAYFTRHRPKFIATMEAMSIVTTAHDGVNNSRFDKCIHAQGEQLSPEPKTLFVSIKWADSSEATKDKKTLKT